MFRRPALLISASLLMGCKAPPEAPEAFSELCAYLFEHQWDEDQEALVVGLEQLATWLDEEWDQEEEDNGFEVTALSEEAMDALDDQDRTAVNMVGLALPSVSEHPVEDATYALVAVDQDVVFPGTFTEYERTYHSGPDCFVDRSCLRMEAEEHMSSSFAGGLAKSESHSFNQYVWAETVDGWAMVHRNWQVEPPEVNLGWLEVDEQTYLNAFVPRTGGAWRLQAQWTVYDPNNNVPENSAKATIINYFQGSHEDLEDWLEENDVP
ncbi:MAG: hypothetical protein JRJ84_05725 [Deltaproteobacteria bacterium]|nr:hypothetical protein [Deltaproteobacteria bacterium]